MNKLYAFVIAAAFFGAQVPAQASTLSYNLSLNPIFGPEGGTGSFTIVAPSVGSSGILTMGDGGLTALDVKIDGLDFTLNNSSEVSYFYQGTNLILASLGFSGTIGADRLLSISLGGVGGYSFTDNAPGGFAYDTLGSVSISPGVSQTPLPTTLPLLATGLGALGLLGLWRKRKTTGLALTTWGPIGRTVGRLLHSSAGG